MHVSMHVCLYIFIYIVVGKTVGIEMRHVAMVGDSVHDMVAGRAAGCYCIAVLTVCGDIRH